MFYWDPSEIAFSLGSVAVRWYSLLWGVGLLGAYVMVWWLYRRQKIPAALFDPLFLYCFVGILIGARLGHCLLYEPAYFLSHPVEMLLPIRQGPDGWHFTGYAGLASHGGTLGLMIALWLYVRKTKVPLWQVLDNIAIATPITACCIRLGNFMNSEIVGKPTAGDFGVVFAALGEDFPRHPGQLYEAACYGVLIIVSYLLYKCLPQKVGTGFFFGFCLTSIFTFRFFVEFCKEVQESWELTMQQMLGINQGQLLSIPFVALGAYCLLRSRSREPQTFLHN